MKEIELEEIKRIEFNILVYIDKVCKDNNLRYSLCGGTLLGAIRHRGFIPWDDDIDIMMPRPDFDKLVDILQTTDNEYKILSPNQDDYYYNFAKIVDSKTILQEHNCQPIKDMGVYIDIFPIEGMPSDSDTRDNHFNKLFRLRKRINSFALLKPRLRKNLIKYTKNLLLYFRNKKASLHKFQQEYETLAKQYNYDESEYVYMSGGAYGIIEMFPKSFVETYSTVKFEEQEFNATTEYHQYLTQLYKDYMKLPPKDKQITHHHFTAKYR